MRSHNKINDLIRSQAFPQAFPSVPIVETRTCVNNQGLAHHGMSRSDLMASAKAKNPRVHHSVWVA